MSAIPNWVLKNMGLTTQRQYKRLKRAQLRAVMKAMDDLNKGSAWLPDFFGYQKARLHLSELKDSLSPGQWGS